MCIYVCMCVDICVCVCVCICVHICVQLHIQGGSDKSGPLSKLHCRIEKHFLLLIILHQIVSAICRSINKNNTTHWSKVESTGSYKSRDSK